MILPLQEDFSKLRNMFLLNRLIQKKSCFGRCSLQVAPFQPLININVYATTKRKTKHTKQLGFA